MAAIGWEQQSLHVKAEVSGGAQTQQNSQLAHLV